MDTTTTVWFYLTKVLKKRDAIEHWMNTHNLLLEGKCPDELMITEEGKAKVLEILKEMDGFK